MEFAIFDNLALGFTTAFTFANLGYCLIGALLGTLIGILPGVGPAATIAMLLPITFSLSPVSALIMLSGIYYGAQYGGSTTAILLNLPGESASVVTTIDGYQMARRGRAGPALAIAAIGSFAAGCFATLVIAVFAPPLTQVALMFGPAEYFSLIVLGLIASVVLARGSFVKAVAMILAGVMFGMVGTDIYTGAARFTLGTVEMREGVAFVALAIGMFGISEILNNLKFERERQITIQPINGLMPSREDLRRSVGPVTRGTLIGSFLGILPGGGALLSSFAAYAVEKKISPNAAEFGKGAIEGVAAPESANNAGSQTSFIPMLTLGIPGNAVMALMAGALIMQGIVPGPAVMTNHPALFWGVIASMWIGNLMLLVLNLPLVGLWVRLLRVPYFVLFPCIMAFCTIGVYGLQMSTFDVIYISFFGLLGFVLISLDCEPAPFVLGFILGPMLEENLRRAMLLSRGDMTIFVTEPICAVLLATAAVAALVVTLPTINRKRDEVFVED